MLPTLILACCILVVGVQGALAQSSAPIATRVLAVGDDQAGRIIIDFDRPVEVAHSLLEGPWRLVLDTERVVFGLSEQHKVFTGLVSDVRYGDMDATHSRMILEFTAPFEVGEIVQQPAGEGLPYSVIIEYRRTDEETFARNRIDLQQTASIVVQRSKSDRLGAEGLVAGARDFVVVLDPGHGGIDSGAVGVTGVKEKDIVLDFAKMLRTELEKYANVRVEMTRETDVFVRLNDRVRVARQNNAQLFVSLHADSVRQDYVRGATVYTISDKASDAVAAELAASENASDAIAGIEYEGEVTEVENILVDLARRETLGLSVQFARLTIGHIQEVARTIKNPHRFAGFRVLKAPDVPSVLVELGYLSNAEDEKLLRDREWRQKMAVELAEAISEFGVMSGRQVALRDTR
ncbi:MAG: N-acetylmuramoyl-L-alanine amidase [Pseudomonadota bacterium]